MGTKVFANGLAVATTTSEHFGMNPDAVAADIRKLGNAPTPRLSKVASTELKVERSSKTKFDGGDVWRQPTEAGPPSTSIPADKLPGIKNGGKVDGKVMAADGAGSPNVYVENARVECHTHLTRQNMNGAIQNSDGKIVDKAEAEAIEKAFLAYLAELARLAELKRQEAARKAAEERQRQLDQRRTNPAPPAKVDTTALQKLGIEGVIVQEGNRIQGLAAGGPADAKLPSGPYLEVNNGSTVTITVIGPGAANAFIRTPVGEKKGPTASYRVGGQYSIAVNPLTAIFGAGTILADWLYVALVDYLSYFDQTVTVTAADVSAGYFTRNVMGFPDAVVKASLQDGKIGPKAKEWKDKLERVVGFLDRLNKLPVRAADSTISISFLQGTFSLEGSWKEDAGKHTCPFDLTAEIGLTIVKCEVGVTVPLDILFPAAKAVMDVVRGIAEFLDIPLRGVYAFAKISGQLDVNGSGSLKLYRPPTQPPYAISGKASGVGKVGISVGLALELTSAVKGSCAITGEATLTMSLWPRGEPLKYSSNVKLVASFEVKIGWFKVGDKTTVSLYDSDLQ